jgi:hypothetical protein
MFLIVHGSMVGARREGVTAVTASRRGHVPWMDIGKHRCCLFSKSPILIVWADHQVAAGVFLWNSPSPYSTGSS